jgi:hypothetical protein
MRSKANVPGSGMVLSGALLLAGAQVALAAPPAVNHEGGLLKLHNVRIETASPAQVAQAARMGPAAGQAGLRAYKDPDSGELRSQTPEEMMEAATAKSAPMSGAAKSMFLTPSGAIAATLDETYMSNATATKDASGKVQMQCVNDAAVAGERVLEGKAGKAHRHDH